MPDVVTLTLNPSLDESTSVEHVLSERKLRCTRTHYEPGGGGVNVSRVLRRFGREAPAIYPSGGPAGALLGRLLDAEGVTHRPVPIAAWTRENFNVLERTSGRQYRFCFEGPELTEDDVARCLAEVASFLRRPALAPLGPNADAASSRRDARPAPAYLVASGSLPPGVPPDFYARVARLARDAGSRLLLDASGDALRLALEAGVFLWKPSLSEFERVAGVSGVDEARLDGLARDLVRAGTCELLVLSLGSRGALWMTRDGGGRIAAPTVPYASGVGAGDSMVAGMVHRLLAGAGHAEVARYGVAAASASVMSPGTALCQPAEVDRLFAAMA